MANVIIKTDESKCHEDFVRKSFGATSHDRASIEAVECISARSREAYETLRKMEGRNDKL